MANGYFDWDTDYSGPEYDDDINAYDDEDDEDEDYDEYDYQSKAELDAELLSEWMRSAL